ncbi:MAG TPA: hypothetical protein VK974_09625 [Methylophilaceae bacterium]|nr:hypothetical protein [Methylophilaceae bacterium]
MNNYNKTELLLDGLDVQGLYLQDVFSIWLHYDRSANPYFTIFMIDNSRITAPFTPVNQDRLLKSGHHISEFLLKDGAMQEVELAAIAATKADELRLA